MRNTDGRLFIFPKLSEFRQTPIQYRYILEVKHESTSPLIQSRFAADTIQTTSQKGNHVMNEQPVTLEIFYSYACRDTYEVFEWLRRA